MIPLFQPNIQEQEIEAIKDTISSNWIGYGENCKVLEKTFVKKFNGWSLATDSCTSALYIAANLIKKGGHNEVIVPAITFIATAIPFYEAGYSVKVADIDSDDLLLDVSSVEKLISKNTRAVVAVHLYGNRCDLSRLAAVCEARKIVLIEDCAHRLDLIDQYTQVRGDFACYSFNPMKEITSSHGGLLWGKDEAEEVFARSISNWGLSIDTHEKCSQRRHLCNSFTGTTGLKFRLDDISASIINCGISQLIEQREKRGSLHRQYKKLLTDCASAVKLIPHKDNSSYLMNVIQVPPNCVRNVRDELSKNNISSSIHYQSLAHHPLFDSGPHGCPVADRLTREIISLPSYLRLTLQDQEKVVSVVSSKAS